MSFRLNQCIITTLYYIVTLVCFLIFVFQANPCAIVRESVIKSKVSGIEDAGLLQLFLLMTALSLYCTFFLALCILVIVIDILMLVRNRQENLVLIYVWICTQTVHILMVLAEFLTVMPWCITKVRQLEGPFLLSISNAVYTAFFLVIVYVYKQQIKAQQKTNIKEISWKSIPVEVQQEVINERK